MSRINFASTSIPTSLLGAVRLRLSSPYVLSLGLGLAASSSMAIAILTHGWFGIVPLITKTAQKSTEQRHKIDIDTCLRLFDFYVGGAGQFFPRVTVISSAAYAAAAYFYQPQPANLAPNLRPWLIAASAIMAGIMPYSIVNHFPLNNKLVDENRKRIAQGSSVKASAADDQDLADAMIRWTQLNYPRVVAVSVGALIGAAALLVS